MGKLASPDQSVTAMTLPMIAICLSVVSVILAAANLAYSLGRQSGYKDGLAATGQGDAGDQ